MSRLTEEEPSDMRRATMMSKVEEYSARAEQLNRSLVPMHVCSIPFDNSMFSQPQMIASQPAVGPRPWTCGTCTFENNPDVQSCEMCETPKPQGGGGDRSGTILRPTCNPEHEMMCPGASEALPSYAAAQRAAEEAEQVCC